LTVVAFETDFGTLMDELHFEIPVGLRTYTSIGARYAAEVDNNAYNCGYERPATTKLLPPLEGLNVLDAGCGSGWYSEYLVDQGAKVTAIDVTPEMVRLTRNRLGDRISLHLADLAQPLSFAASSEFDLVVSALALHYLRDVAATIKEFHRILKSDGILVFSTHHPSKEFSLHPEGNYFDTVLVEEQWSVGTVQFYRRPLTAWTEALANSGFVIERLMEIEPNEDLRKVAPGTFKLLINDPAFMVIRARNNKARLSGKLEI
jgi:SAM-dependent methyltransferase